MDNSTVPKASKPLFQLSISKLREQKKRKRNGENEEEEIQPVESDDEGLRKEALPTSIPKLDNTLVALLKKKVHLLFDVESQGQKLLRKTEDFQQILDTGKDVPNGLKFKNPKAKGLNAEALQQKFEAIRKRAETEALTEVISDHKAQINELKEKYDTQQLEIKAIIEQWKHLFQSNESYSKFRDKANIYVEEAYKFVEKFYFQLSLQHTSKQLVENLKTRDKPRGMDTNDAFSPDEPTIREIVRQEIKVAVKIPHFGKMSQSKRGRSITIKKSPIAKGTGAKDSSGGRSQSRSKSRSQSQTRSHVTSKSPVPQSQKPQNFRYRSMNRRKRKQRQRKPGGPG